MTKLSASPPNAKVESASSSGLCAFCSTFSVPTGARWTLAPFPVISRTATSWSPHSRRAARGAQRSREGPALTSNLTPFALTLTRTPFGAFTGLPSADPNLSALISAKKVVCGRRLRRCARRSPCCGRPGPSPPRSPTAGQYTLHHSTAHTILYMPYS
ncbi:unnamed protein product [Colias eurytheme]|nr:unnamed protein product [Colias eurytheme]